ncbi:MAG: PA2928 family protein, partial [Gemmatimonadaceae bacterium]
MITPPRSRSRAGLWIVVIVVLSLIGGLVICLLRQSNRSFESFDMAGGPLVITDSTSGEAVTITSHWEKREFVTNDNTIVRESRLHWDVWAFSLRDLSRNWVTRLATIKNGDRNIDAAILGADSDVIWLLADDIMAVSTKDGHVVADAAAIEAKNPVLRGMMPRSARQIAFDDGLVLLAADGRRWHVDSRTLNATPAATSNSADGRRKTYRTLRLLSQYQHYKTRSYQVDGRWYGLVHASEAAALQREMIGQSFASPLRYSLWSAPMRDTVDRFGNKGVTPGKLAPLATSEEFLQGGLLAVPDTAGTERVIGIAKPTRLLVLHQTRIDDDG